MVRERTLHVVRDEIIKALFIDVRTPGQLDFDGSMVTNYGRATSKKDEVTGQLMDTEYVRGSASRGYKTNSCPLAYDAFHSTKISRAVNALPDHLNSLALYAYTHRCEWRHVEVVSRHVWHLFLVSHPKKFRVKKLKTLKGMVLLAMQDWKNKIQTGKELNTPARVRELLKINENHWRRDWLPFWREMQNLLCDVENQVLMNVYRSTRKKTKSHKKEVAAA